MNSRQQKKTAWLAQTCFNDISNWDIQKCLDFLNLSEKAQKNLPNSEKASVSREHVRQRLLELLPDDRNIPSNFDKSIAIGVDAINQLTYLLNYRLHQQGIPGLHYLLHCDDQSTMERTVRGHTIRLEEIVKQLFHPAK